MSEPTLEMRQLSFSLLKPEVLVGAASPLWGYFVGAALTGAAWWWMSRWMEAAAASFPMAAMPAQPSTAPQASARAGGDRPVVPIGGEAGPISAAAAAPEGATRAALEPIEALSAAAAAIVGAETAVVLPHEADDGDVADVAAETAARAARRAPAEGDPKPH